MLSALLLKCPSGNSPHTAAVTFRLFDLRLLEQILVRPMDVALGKEAMFDAEPKPAALFGYVQ